MADPSHSSFGGERQISIRRRRTPGSSSTIPHRHPYSTRAHRSGKKTKQQHLPNWARAFPNRPVKPARTTRLPNRNLASLFAAAVAAQGESARNTIMGLFDGGRSHSYSGHGRSHSYSGNSRSYSPARSVRSTHSSASKGFFVRPSASRSSSSFFGIGGGSRGWGGSSSYRRSPRQGYISYLFHKLQRMLRELMYYARRHPIKAFFAVVVPLLSAGGAIHGLMRQFGVNTSGGTRTMRGGYYGSSGYSSGGGGGLGGLMGGRDSGGLGGLMGNAGGLMQVARAFM